MESLQRDAFFLECMNEGLYMKRDWLLHAFSRTRRGPCWDKPKYPFFEEGKWWAMYQVGDELKRLEIVGVPYQDSGLMFHKWIKLSVAKGGFPGLMEDVTTTMGMILFHFLTKVYPFGDRFPFLNKSQRIRDVEAVIADKLTAVPADPEEKRDPEKIYVDELIKFTESAGMYMAGTTQLFTPCSTPKSLVTDPRVYEVRDKRIKELEAAGKLTDPTEVAKLKKELGAIDREWIKGDPSEDWLIGKKSFNIVRMKTRLIHGEEFGFGDGTQITVIPTSLSEGLDLKHLPDYVNSAREGSYNRGHQTMLGGEAFSFLSRIFQNTSIIMEDCGRTVGRYKKIDARIANDFIGNYIVEGGKTVIELTPENIGKYAGKMVVMRSPQYCGARKPNFCGKCMGNHLAQFADSLGSIMGDVGSIMLYMFMGKAHATELKTFRFNPNTAIR